MPETCICRLHGSKSIGCDNDHNVEMGFGVIG